MSAQRERAGKAGNGEVGGGAEPGELGRELGPLESLMRKAAHDPHGRGTGMGIWILDRAPDWDRLVHTWDLLSRVVPRFRQRIVDPPLQFPAAWVVDPDFDLGYHLRRVRVPEPGTLRQVLDLARPMLMAELDPARPLWETTLVEGLEDGRAALIQKADHAIGDGQGGMRMMEVMYDRTRDAEPGPMPQAPEPEDVAPVAVLRTAVAERLRAAPRTGPQVVGRLMSTAGTALLRPRRSVSQVLGFAASAQRLMRPGATSPSPLLQGRSLSHHFDVLEMSVDDLRRAGKAAGGSLNDAYLAAVTGGLRLYHERLGSPVERLPMGVPISIRREGDPLASNRFAGAILPAPVGVADPRARIVRIHEQVLRARSEPALSGLELLAPVLRLLPQPLLEAAMNGGRRDVQASNLAGPQFDVYMAGAKLLRMYGMGPLPGCAVMVGLMSHLGTCCIGVNSDPAAVTQPDVFVACLQEGFEEVLDVGGDHQPVLAPAPPAEPEFSSTDT